MTWRCKGEYVGGPRDGEFGEWPHPTLFFPALTRGKWTDAPPDEMIAFREHVYSFDEQAQVWRYMGVR